MNLPVVLDDPPMERRSKICSYCKHLRDTDARTCDAFPDRVPDFIWSGQNLHQEPFEGDQGIQFEFKDSVVPKVRAKVLAGKG